MSLIYHITVSTDWQDALAGGSYTISTRGLTLAEQGFIHCSTEDQVTTVANFIYRGDTDLIVLVIDSSRVSAQIRYEKVPGSDDEFPHIYGPLNIDAVIGTVPLNVNADGMFAFTAPKI